MNPQPPCDCPMDSDYLLQKKILSNLYLLAGAVSRPGHPTDDAVAVQGAGFVGRATVQRGGNTTQYTAGDVVGGVLTIVEAGPDSADVLLDAVRIVFNIAAKPAAMSTFSLHFYNTSPPSAIADNAPFTLGADDRPFWLGKIDAIAPVLVGTGTSSVVAETENIVKQLRTKNGRALYAYLVTDGAYTPAANSETYSLTTHGVLP
jgi:hypothetical protein